MTIGKLATVSAALALASLACDARTLIGMVPDGSANDDGGPGSVDSAPASNGDATAVVDGSPTYDGFVGGFTVDAGKGTCAPLVFPGDARYTLPAASLGTWTGYFEGSSPLPTSDVVRFSIQQLADGSGEIHITMGTATPPPPATSATDYYPPGLQTASFISSPWLIDGFTYLAHAVTWQGQRLRLSLKGAQPWESWCALQPTFALVDEPGTYSCVPGTNGRFSNLEGCFAEDANGTKETRVSCAELYMCESSYCGCDACGCAAGTQPGVGFDLTFDGNTAAGVGAGHNVRLTRDAI